MLNTGFDPKIFDDIAKRLNDVLPASIRDIEADLQQKFRSILQATFAKMELVTREEFDAQCKVLGRTREKLEKLQKQIAKMEKQLKTK